MSLFQCGNCGCCENTALGHYWCADRVDSYMWDGIESRKGKKLCSEYGPQHYSDGNKTEFGEWHNQFDKVILPKGMFKTNHRGNLEHIETGEEDFRKFKI